MTGIAPTVAATTNRAVTAPGARDCRRRSRSITAGLLLLLALGVALPQGAAARSTDEDESGRSLVGSYLAGRFARSNHDTDRAASFYQRALVLDPENEVLVEQAFLMEATQGNWGKAMALAEQLAARNGNHRTALTVLGLRSFKADDLAKADEHLKASANGPIGELTAAIARGWVKLAQGKPDEALDLLVVPKQAEWAQFYLHYHRALIADIAGRASEARSSFERVFKQDSRSLRTALAYARHAAITGDSKLARSILKEHIDRSGGEGHPLARALRDEIAAGTTPSLLIPTPAEGLAEVFYGLGEALAGEGGVSIGTLYLQLALYLKPDQPFALAALANAYETTKKYDDAITVYDRIPKGSPLQRSIDIRKALNLNSLDRVDEAKALLEDVARADPADIKPLDALGNIMRARKRYDEAVTYYTRAIALIPKPDKRHWTYYYSRGTAYERLKKWPPAEQDLQKALQLSPDQPLVLNYLGYSWIDQNKNLKQGMALIEKAVTLKPDDGYIVDSLGWAHYKLGNFKDAVRYLERAVELRPEDPVLNDHLGDALWRVGREREAKFQWDQALQLKPEPEEVDKIKRKLVKGLPTKPQARLNKKTKEASRVDQQRKRSDGKSGPAAAQPLVE